MNPHPSATVRSLACALALALPALRGHAQQAVDTVRIALTEPLRTLVQAEEPRPEAELFTAAVFDSLVCFDGAKREFRPELAESWTQPDDRTVIFKLRRDVKWHDGAPFNADDVVYTLNYYVDPASKLYMAANEAKWLRKVEKLDDYTVKISAASPTPMMFSTLAWNAQILPRRHGALADRTQFGRKSPVGTGPYKVVSIDAGKGLVLVRNEAYYGKAGDCKPPARIRNVQALPIPDAQTQSAELMTGGIELMRGASREEAELMPTNPAIKVSVHQVLQFFFLNMDAAGRSGVKPLQDVRVRRAIAQAINRDEIGRAVVPGGSAVRPVDAFCVPASVGCFSSKRPPAYDPAAARVLLAQAGLAAGFDVQISALPGAGQVAEAIAGQLRRVGIRASVANLPFSVYRQRQVDGKLQLVVSIQGQPDATGPAQLLLDGGTRDYARDPAVTALLTQSLATADPAARKSIDIALFDMITDKSYVLPLVTKPDVFMHDAALVVPAVTGRPGTSLEALSWR